ERWRRRLERIAAIGAPLEAAVLSIGFARQFDYYDGFVFEVRDPALGPAEVLAAGGRYDHLPARLGAAGPVPAVGCVVRPGRLAASAERST
ncbi:MAG: ATP phosphoribosyltransferase regulatory subunit, partial [Caulobacterales bacterium]|nr:ATP phosphoribosyltransferase regulatory subunit [Caulobacterales bacterium]